MTINFSTSCLTAKSRIDTALTQEVKGLILAVPDKGKLLLVVLASQVFVQELEFFYYT